MTCEASLLGSLTCDLDAGHVRDAAPSGGPRELGFHHDARTGKWWLLNDDDVHAYIVDDDYVFLRP